MCKTKCSCLYRITESTIAGQKVYYPEYAKRLFPWKWKRLDVSMYDTKTGKANPLFFNTKSVANDWLKSFREHHDPILADRRYQHNR